MSGWGWKGGSCGYEFVRQNLLYQVLWLVPGTFVRLVKPVGSRGLWVREDCCVLWASKRSCAEHLKRPGGCPEGVAGRVRDSHWLPNFG